MECKKLILQNAKRFLTEIDTKNNRSFDSLD